MGYERDSRRFSSDDNRYDRNRSDGGRYGRGDSNRQGQTGGDDRDDRGFFDRAGDEVRSWFGDEEAERRRRYDERYGSDDDRQRGYGARSHGDRGRSSAGQFYGQSDRGQNGQGYGWGGATQSNQSDNRFGGGSGGYQSQSSRDQSPHDENYRAWRDRQMEALDRDYHDYRRENQSKFETEFHGYRTQRQGQRDLLGKVQEHQEVVGSDGQHVGKVDHVRGDRILLAKNDQAAGGHHHSIPSSWLQSVDEKVTISKTAEEAKRAWRDEDEGETGGGLFGQRKDQGREDEARTNLNRSFSGTY